MSTTSDPISSISALLSLSDSQYRIYDIGRKVDKISKAQFEKIEAAQLPYPYPSQGHALLAIAFWQKQSTSPYLWFVKLPLDERGLLNQGARNHFIAIIIERIKDLVLPLLKIRINMKKLILASTILAFFFLLKK